MHTALMEASMDGHVDVARLLLDHGAQVRTNNYVWLVHPINLFQQTWSYISTCSTHFPTPLTPSGARYLLLLLVLLRHSVKAGMRNGMEHGTEYGTEYGMTKLVLKESC